MVIVDLNKAPEEDESPFPIMLCKDDKIISQVHCYNPPMKVPESLHIKDIYPAAVFPLSSLPRIYFHAAGQTRFQINEWGTFVSYLLKRDKVAVCPYGRYEFLIIPPTGKDPASCDRVAVAYRVKKSSRDGEVLDSVASADNRVKEPMCVKGDARLGPQNSQLYTRPFHVHVKSEDVYVEQPNNLPLHARPIKGDVTRRDFRECKEHNPQPVNEQAAYEITNPSKGTIYPEKIPNEELLALQQCLKLQTENNFVSSVSHYGAVSQPTLGGNRREISHLNSFRPSLVHTHPSYLETLGQNHAGWIFGGIAELIDNSRDANATRLDISIEMEYYRRAGKRIPVLVMVDNGSGMSHADIVRMLSFGHKSPEMENRNLIGRFGVGFKTGTMRLGRDVVVLTQSTDTRSIAFLSRSFNEDKNDVEIPIITYRKQGGWMEFDLEVHSEEEAMTYLKAIKDFSPFNEYAIGTKFASFGEDGTGTQIYVYNLDMWGSDYSLQWDNKNIGEGNNFTKKRDIFIRSRRVRSRPGQMSQEVPLDYSLHAYLEVIFLDPRMKIFVQGTRVKSRPLAKSLNKTKVIKGVLLDKNVELILGRSQEERMRGNCGIFLYWHGRLVEAYKRVGGMIHSADMGRGVIGVIDVTEIMNNGNGCVWVLNTKQGFQDCEAYAKLEQWLGSKADEYWDENFDTLELRDQSKGYKPDYDWVQCNKCRKWRILDPSFNNETLPDDWFCYMPPFNGSCSIAEQKVEPGVITVGAKRSSGGFTSTRQLQPVKEEGNTTPVNDSIVTNNNRDESEATTESEDDLKIIKRPPLKRLRRGPATRAMTQKRSIRH